MSGLLITIGDSWTEGMGSPTKTPYGKYIAERLNYDFINLGFGGNSNSGAAKLLLQEKYEKFKQTYDDVLVIFLLSDPTRFSFFTDYNRVLNFSAGQNEEFYVYYMTKVVRNVKVDPARETVFYLKSVEYFCKVHGYRFYYGTAFTEMEDVNILYKTDGALMSYGSMKKILLLDEIAPCGHPNDIGYKRIANYILDRLHNKFEPVY